MVYTAGLETEDKSYYADWLENLTGISRAHWGQFSLGYLRNRFQKELRDIHPEAELQNH